MYLVMFRKLKKQFLCPFNVLHEREVQAIAAQMKNVKGSPAVRKSFQNLGKSWYMDQGFFATRARFLTTSSTIPHNDYIVVLER